MGESEGLMQPSLPLSIRYMSSSPNKRIRLTLQEWLIGVNLCSSTALKYLPLASAPNRLRSVPPATRRRPPFRWAAGRSEQEEGESRGGAEGAGSKCFQSGRGGAPLGRRDGKQPSRLSECRRCSQRHRHSEVESRHHQLGLSRRRGGETSDSPAPRERGAGCVEPRGWWGAEPCTPGGPPAATLLLLLPGRLLPERSAPRFLLRPGIAALRRCHILWTLFLRPHQTTRLPWPCQTHRVHPLLLRGGSRPCPAWYDTHSSISLSISRPRRETKTLKKWSGQLWSNLDQQ